MTFTKYTQPYINASTPYILTFRPFEQSDELSIITTDDYCVVKAEQCSFSLSDGEQSGALTFTIGVEADTEGAYQNNLGIYMKSMDCPNLEYFLGVIAVKTEVIGEDERFRTLIGNFGVPDPI